MAEKKLGRIRNQTGDSALSGFREGFALQV
jgi:hypothetical protein